MSDLLAARSQMAMSLAFHILFAVVGMAMPLLMVLAEGLWLRTRDPGWLTLAKRWSKGTAVLFAVGAVSGTVLSFELGLLWPAFMEKAGPLIGMPFSLEGFAFFLEAIFLGVYLYGWDKVPEKVHLASGVGVLISGVSSAIFVVAANAWMNAPAGYVLVDGEFTDIHPMAPFLSSAFPTQALHMVLAAFVSVGFMVAGAHAWRLLRNPRSGFDAKALSIALAVGGVTAFLQPLSGDLSAKHLAHEQPVKLAAMEGHWETEAGAPLRIGGWPDEEAEETPYSLDIPYALSILAFMDPNAEVMGLKEVPRDERPPVLPTHLAFQLMVGAGVGMMGVAALGALLAWRRRGLPTDPRYLKLVVAAAPLGLIGLEAGWMVTELGRQPWVIQGVLRTSEAVTPMPGLVLPFTTFTLLYLFLGVSVVGLLRRIVFAPLPEGEEADHAA
ncbi:MAG: cytochrome ubiquinol oxidase subunit I [Alphaproteobacteria bacterium]|nr:cytochrome ubiquinol oxidase subunit I [Alphaproteobacteria bacterium]MCB9797824.1 cytochrome ubiquinol oxidase subunit I [Alphaproteobacteria bacterium]